MSAIGAEASTRPRTGRPSVWGASRRRLAAPHPSIARRATAARPFRRGLLSPGRAQPSVRFPAQRHAPRRGHRGLKWVDSSGSVVALRTTGMGAKRGVQGGQDEPPGRVESSCSPSRLPALRASATQRMAITGVVRSNSIAARPAAIEGRRSRLFTAYSTCWRCLRRWLSIASCRCRRAARR